MPESCCTVSYDFYCHVPLMLSSIALLDATALQAMVLLSIGSILPVTTQHPLPTAATIRLIVKSTPLEAIRLPPAMHVIRTIILLLEDLRLLHEIIAITLRLQFAGATWTIIECAGLLPRLHVMSLALVTTALMTQLHTLAAIPLRRLETTIDMTDDLLRQTTDMEATLLPPLSGQGLLLEGGLHHVGKNLRGRHGLYNLCLTRN